MSGKVAAKDIHIHGAYGSTVVSPPGDTGVEALSQNSRSNVQLYLKKVKEPKNLTQIKRKGCSGWPCQNGYLCDFCLLRPEWTAEARLDTLKEEVRELRQTVNTLREQQADVETLRRAEKMVSGKHWSVLDEGRMNTINSLVEDSKTRLEAQSAVQAQRAAETVRDGVLQQLSALQAKADQKDRQLSAAHQRIEALSEMLSDCQQKLRTATQELDNKRMMIADAFKEKSRAVQDVIRAQSKISIQDSELLIKAQQVKDLIERLQKLQDVEAEKDRYRELAKLRADLAKGIMEQVGEDIVMAERVRDEHVHTIKKLNKEGAKARKMMSDQQQVISKLRTHVRDVRASVAATPSPAPSPWPESTSSPVTVNPARSHVTPLPSTVRGGAK